MEELIRAMATHQSHQKVAVVYYCLVPIDSLTQVTNFKVLDILDVAEKFHIDLPHQNTRSLSTYM